MRLTVTLPDKLSENLKKAASNRGMSVSGLVAEAVEQHLITQRKLALGREVLKLAGNVPIASNIQEMIEEGRRDDRA